MSNTPHNRKQIHEELQSMVDGFCDGSLPPEQGRRLNEILHNNPDAQSQFLACASVHAQLNWEFGSFKDVNSANIHTLLHAAANSLEAAGGCRTDSGKIKPPEGRAHRQLWARRWLGTLRQRWAWAVVSLLALGLVLFWTTPSGRSPRPVSIARLTGSFHAQWADPATGFEIGQSLNRERLRLAAGVVEVTFSIGAVVLLEGPVDFEIRDANRGFLHRGQAVARLSQNASAGFVIETAQAKVVDLGTEFGVKAGRSNETEIQVFTGKVVTEWKPADHRASDLRRLEAGQALRISGDTSAVAQEVPYQPERFIRQLPDPASRGANATNPINESRHSVVRIMPAPTSGITVDGDLSDWNLEGRFIARCHEPYGRNYFVEGSMMYDAKFLYIGAHVGDPFPLRSIVDPKTDADYGWRGGSIQVRLSTDRKLGWPLHAKHPDYRPVSEALPEDTSDKLVHLTLWHFEPKEMDCLEIAYGMDFHGGQVNPSGYRGVFKKTEGAMGYNFEYAIPWTLLNAADDPPRAGDVLATTWIVHWADVSGRIWQGKLVEIRNPNAEGHSFYRADTWGQAIYALERTTVRP